MNRRRRIAEAEREAGRLAALLDLIGGLSVEPVAGGIVADLGDELTAEPTEAELVASWRELVEVAAHRLREAGDPEARRRALSESAALRAALLPRVRAALERQRAEHDARMRGLLASALRLTVAHQRTEAAARSQRASAAGRKSGAARVRLDPAEVARFVERKVAAGSSVADARSAARAHFQQRDSVSRRTIDRALRKN